MEPNRLRFTDPRGPYGLSPWWWLLAAFLLLVLVGIVIGALT
jgi:hypothetical protein